MLYRKRDKINHPFIHLNLCIALALGLIVFLAGIETATENRVSIQLYYKVVKRDLIVYLHAAMFWLLAIISYMHV